MCVCVCVCVCVHCCVSHPLDKRRHGALDGNHSSIVLLQQLVQPLQLLQQLLVLLIQLVSHVFEMIFVVLVNEGRGEEREREKKMEQEFALSVFLPRVAPAECSAGTRPSEINKFLKLN